MARELLTGRASRATPTGRKSPPGAFRAGGVWRSRRVAELIQKLSFRCYGITSRRVQGGNSGARPSPGLEALREERGTPPRARRRRTRGVREGGDRQEDGGETVAEGGPPPHYGVASSRRELRFLGAARLAAGFGAPAAFFAAGFLR